MIRDGRFDVVVAAGPRAEPWPSVGVRALSAFCSDMGLSVGIFGGASISVKGVIPLPGAGALVLAQDVQNRIHRIQARAVVRLSAAAQIPDPFQGWYQQGLIPLSTARKLLRSRSVEWEPGVVILGTGNEAFRFGSELLESGVGEVICAETHAQWGAKRFSGWEVEKRRFEMAGGKVVEAQPVSLSIKSPLIWEFRIRDSQGVRILEVSHVVSAGPFMDLPQVREYPAGSLLFELEQSAGETKEENVDGWMLEEERGRLIASKIVKAIAPSLGQRRDAFDKIARRTRGRLKRYVRHRQEPFTPGWQGKWILPSDMRRIREFGGIPKTELRTRWMPTIECLEDICCDVCQVVCPEKAISSERSLLEDKCSGCGYCVQACPSGAISMIFQKDEHSSSTLGLAWRGEREWKTGELATLLNRRGEVLGSGRVLDPHEPMPGVRVSKIVKVDVPSHLAWEARGLKRPKVSAAEDQSYLSNVDLAHRQEQKVEVTIDGEKRRVRDQVTISTALFEIGQARPGDILHCSDGSCGLCEVQVDGVKKLGCQTKVHKGMSVQLIEKKSPSRPGTGGAEALCPCQGISVADVVERIRQGRLSSPEAVLSVAHVGEGKCRGERCLDPFKRLLAANGMDLSQWIDWRFPWSEWTLGRN